MAGTIVSQVTDRPGSDGERSGCAYGFGGWNLDNVTVLLNPSTEPNPVEFDPLSGCYDFPADSDHTYYADVDDGSGMVVGRVLAKDWPIGEPPGIKVVNDDPNVNVRNGRPANCIMATSYLDGGFLDSGSPAPVLCSGPYQSHKRFKVAMLPEILESESGSVDLEFNVVADPSRQYEVFQKINNWTNQRLTGFTIEVGFGVGDQFQAATGTAADNLHLTVPDTLWRPDQLAVFSAGLFGPLDEHGQIGFFDDKTRAGFFIDEYGTDAGNQGTQALHATRRLGSNYDELPRGVEAMNQFGLWLPNNALPYGIFFDDDGNPDTDAVLVAWYGYNPAIGGLGWMGGVADKFAAVDDAVITSYANNLLYTVAVIDDLVNVGLNYIVTVDDITEFPEQSPDRFTIRVTPTALAPDAPEAAFPPYVEESVDGMWQQVLPDPWLAYTASPSVLLQPGPVFEQGQVLTARVGDAGADSDSAAIDTVTVEIAVDGTYAETLTLYELGEDRAVFAANLPSDYSNEDPGTVITMTYGDLTASTTAVTPQDPPVSYDLSITEFDVPESLADGRKSRIRVGVQNPNQALVSASGFVSLTGSVDGEPKYTFDDQPFVLDPGKKLRTNFLWTASLKYPDVAEIVEWEVEVFVDATPDPVLITSDSSASTEVLPKAGKNAKN